MLPVPDAVDAQVSEGSMPSTICRYETRQRGLGRQDESPGQ